MRLGWCSREAATHACVHWHYSRKLPAAKLMHLGVWDEGRLVGVIIFGYGATPTLCKSFSLRQQEVAELVRVALKDGHRFPTSRALGVALRMLRRSAPGLKLVVSFADSQQGHHGGIYQATNWLYLGPRPTNWLRIHGQMMHPRTAVGRYKSASVPFLRERVDPRAESVPMPPKHRYVLPLCPEQRAKLAPQAQPYPKRQPAG